MSFLIWLIVGGILGWLSCLVMRNESKQSVLLHVIVGIIGAFVGGWVISPLLDVHTSFGSMVVSLIGAIILLAIMNLFLHHGRRG